MGTVPGGKCQTKAEASPRVGNRFSQADPKLEIRLRQCHTQGESQTRTANTQNQVAKVRITSAGGLKLGRQGQRER